jgi:hypothetical protein
MDFRGFLQQNAPRYLAFTGNDAQIDPTKKGYETNYASYVNTPQNRQKVQQEVSALYGKYQQSQNPTSVPPGYGGGGGGVSYAPTAPNWDINSIYNSAGAGAAAQVNPYYTKQLQDFQANQAKAKAIQQQQHDLNELNLEGQLNNQLGQNELQRGRTSADTLQNEQQIGITADQRQQDQGTQFEQARLEQAKQLASGGLTGAGLGNQQTLQSETAYNTQEQRQGAQDQQQVAAQELSKARTFEDLANSDVLSNKSFTQGQKQANIDWDKFVQGQSSDLQSTQQSLESERLQRLSSVQKQLAQQQLNNMIHALSNPGQRAAAAAAYGGAF